MTQPTTDVPMMSVDYRELVDFEQRLEAAGREEFNLIGAITSGAQASVADDESKLERVGLAGTVELAELLEGEVPWTVYPYGSLPSDVTEVWLGVFLEPTVWSTLLEKGEPAGLIPEAWLPMVRWHATEGMHLDLSLAEVGIKGQAPMAMPPGDMPWFVDLLDHCEVEYSLTYLPAGPSEDEED